MYKYCIHGYTLADAFREAEALTLSKEVVVVYKYRAHSAVKQY